MLLQTCPTVIVTYRQSTVYDRSPGGDCLVQLLGQLLLPVDVSFAHRNKSKHMY